MAEAEGAHKAWAIAAAILRGALDAGAVADPTRLLALLLDGADDTWSGRNNERPPRPRRRRPPGRRRGRPAVPLTPQPLDCLPKEPTMNDSTTPAAAALRTAAAALRTAINVALVAAGVLGLIVAAAIALALAVWLSEGGWTWS